jgi:PAS domain-containing protein
VTQHPVELIVLKQVASYLATPVFLVDPGGNLLYYNEPAEPILGCRFDERGEMTLSEWSTEFVPEDEDGRALPAENLPLVIALHEGRPAHSSFFITGLDGHRRPIAVTAFPLVAQSGHNLGAVALFWTEGA